MTLALTIFISLALLMWVAMPLTASRISHAPTVGQELDAERIQYLLRSIRSLYESKELGKTSEEDFQNIESRLFLELARLYHARGLKPEQISADQQPVAVQQESAEPGEAACTTCGASVSPDYRFCPACGNQQAQVA